MKKAIIALLALIAFPASAQQEAPVAIACKQMLGAAVGRELDAWAMVAQLQAEVAKLKAIPKPAEAPK